MGLKKQAPGSDRLELAIQCVNALAQAWPVNTRSNLQFDGQ